MITEGMASVWVGGQEVPATLSVWSGGQEVPVPAVQVNVCGIVPQGPTVTSFLAEPDFKIAHRCGGGNFPEFSMHGIEQSIMLGYQALEISVYRASTGEFVCSHDWTTERMCGERHEIYQTPWEVLQALTSTAEFTDDPAQPRRPLIRLTDVVERYGQSHVIFIDHKATSAGGGNAADHADKIALLDYLDSIPNAAERFIWKCFRDGYATADLARTRGYKSWGIYYDGEIEASPNRVSSFDVLGMNWNATQTRWDAITATGKPVIGHIIETTAQATQSRARGSDGLMVSIPKQIPA